MSGAYLSPNRAAPISMRDIHTYDQRDNRNMMRIEYLHVHDDDVMGMFNCWDEVFPELPSLMIHISREKS